MIRAKVLGRKYSKRQSRPGFQATFSDVCPLKAKLRSNDIRIQVLWFGKPPSFLCTRGNPQYGYYFRPFLKLLQISQKLARIQFLKSCSKREKEKTEKMICSFIWSGAKICNLYTKNNNRLFAAKPSRDLLIIKLWAATLRMPKHQNGQV